MANNIEGGRRAAQTNRERYGEDYYKKMGALGGSVSRGGGFTGDPQRARKAGSKGGKSGWTPERRKAASQRLRELHKARKGEL